MATYNYEIGTSIYDLLNLEDDLSLNAPHQDSMKGSTQDQDGADGLIYGHGWGETTWSWGFISETDRAILRSYCTTRSASVVIRTRDEDGVWTYYTAVMIWPDETAAPMVNTLLNFQLKFRLTENLGISL